MSSPNLDHIRLSDAVEGGRISNGRNEDPQGFQSFSLISPTGSESGSEDRGGGEGGGLDADQPQHQQATEAGSGAGVERNSATDPERGTGAGLVSLRLTRHSRLLGCAYPPWQTSR